MESSSTPPERKGLPADSDGPLADKPVSGSLGGGGLVRDLGRLLGSDHVVTEGPRLREALHDGTSQGVEGTADALVLPGNTEEVAAVMAWCYERGVPLTTRGGGTGLAGGAVPDGGIVLSMERMNRVLSIDPGLWRMQVEAGVTTGNVHRVALENGLYFPPDPGASEQSMIGGNLATNAGGPHAFKYGVTGNWVTGIEAVVPPGDVLRSGGPIRKDVSGYDLISLMVGSEGTLGIITSAWLRLVPAPEARSAVVGFYKDTRAGCDAIEMILGSGIQPTALEYLDRGALAASIGAFPFEMPADAGFAVLAEADGSTPEVERVAGDLVEAMTDGAVGDPLALTDRGEVTALWAWREGVSLAVAAQRGGKMSEDVVVPLERLAEAIEETLEIGRTHNLEACSWGHAGDGNLHSSFLIDPANPEETARATEAAGEIFRMAIRLGGSISGEHGIGTLKTDFVVEALDPTVLRMQGELKRLFDPRGLLNPEKKVLPLKSS